MKDGWIPAGSEFHWVEEPQHNIWGGVVLSSTKGMLGTERHIPKSSVTKGIIRNIEAHICENCKKVIINYE
jgi:hypothetical protein